MVVVKIDGEKFQLLVPDRIKKIHNYDKIYIIILHFQKHKILELVYKSYALLNEKKIK